MKTDCNAKRKIEKLVTCETDGEKLKQAAEIRKDQRILTQIHDVDPVCIEVRYHASCYKKYVKCLAPKDSSKRPLTFSFDKFCTEVIDKRIIDGEEIITMNNLTKLFKTYASDLEDIDIGGYRNFQLKSRIVKKYPDLQFASIKSCVSELVLMPSKKASVATVLPFSDSESTNSESENEVEASAITKHDEFAQLYRCGLSLRKYLDTAHGLTEWPPMADALTPAKCLELIPVEVFNFIAWCIGISQEFSIDRVSVENDDSIRKILSIAQDLVTLASRGRKLMPKHIALGMTVRHLSGSAKIQQLLNNFGHCVSHSTTLEHDTSLAAQQLHFANQIPPGFNKNTFTTLVWDNNDFGEETLTGKGTTHNTNGIIIQTYDPSIPKDAAFSVSVSRNRKRTIQPPPVDMPFYQHAKPRRGPDQFRVREIDLERNTDVQTRGKYLDRMLWFSKYSQDSRSRNMLPGWTACNQMMTKPSDKLSKIGYLPVIDASPTDSSTINAILHKSCDIARDLEVQSVVVVMDQAIYAKAQEIRWQGTDELKNQLILRLGEFHIAMAFLSVIGKRYRDAGLQDIAIESGLVAEGSINTVMNGHQYNRSVRCHKVIAESMFRLQLGKYLEQLPEVKVNSCIQMMETIRNDYPGTTEVLINDEPMRQFLDDFQTHVQLMCNNNATYALWTSYIEIVELLLLFIRATREGHWQLHLSCVRDMIPWFFSYGKINYSRYLPLYYLEMKDLEFTHPNIHAEFMTGRFAVQRHDRHGFAMTPCDQVIEQTFNRDSKTKGGMTGITLNKGAVHRWILSYPQRAEIAGACYTLSGKNTMCSRPELAKTRMVQDEQAVQDVMSTIIGFANPFCAEERDDQLWNISSGAVAPSVVKSDLFSAFQAGECSFKEYIGERLFERNKDVFDKLSLPKLKTFSDIGKKMKSKMPDSSAHENRNLLMRMLVIAQQKGLDLREVVTYPLSSLPAAFANYNGSMTKTDKASLMRNLEKRVNMLEDEMVPAQETVVIVDGMAMIQQRSRFPETFGDFSDSVVQQLLAIARKHNAKRIDFVADRYMDVSIKNCERERRAATSESLVRIVRRDQRMPKQMKKFLTCSGNKEALLLFLIDEWKETRADILGDVQIFVDRGESCYKICVDDGERTVEEVPELHSDHEEADTRIFLHIAHVQKSYLHPLSIIIRSPDTDVCVIAIWIASLLPLVHIKVYLTIATRPRTVDVTEISRKLGTVTSEAIVGLHSFTGCDTVSAFKGKGKFRTLNMMLASSKYTAAFSELGRSWRVSDDLARILESFVCELYGWKDCVEVNTARYNAFICAMTETSFPPNKDSLHLHILRANYQAAIHKSCLQQQICAPSPEEHGWKKDDSRLSIVWRTMSVAPPSVVNYVHCRCKKEQCKSNQCSCRKASLQCTDLCNCRECKNLPGDNDSQEEPGDGDSDSDVEGD